MVIAMFSGDGYDSGSQNQESANQVGAVSLRPPCFLAAQPPDVSSCLIQAAKAWLSTVGAAIADSKLTPIQVLDLGSATGKKQWRGN